MSVWSHGTPEKFIMHILQAIMAIKAKGLQEAYEKLVWAKKECTKKLEEAVLNCDLMEGKVKDDSALSKAVDKASEAQVKVEKGFGLRRSALRSLRELY